MNILSKPAMTLIAVVILCLASATSARADTVVFTTREAFIAASTNLATIDFEGIAPINSVANFFAPLTLQGVTFSDSVTGQISVVDPGFFAPLFQFNSGAVLAAFAFIEVTLPAGITALGTDIMSTNPDGQTFDVLLSNGEVFSVNTPFRPERGFFGVTSDVAITSIRFTVAPGPVQGITLVDNFTSGQAQTAPVPEPSTLILLGSGLAGIAAQVKRRWKGFRLR